MIWANVSAMLFIGGSWYPLVGYQRAARRAFIARDATASMQRRALELRDLGAAQIAALDAAVDPMAKENAATALQSTATELQELATALAPSRARMSQAFSEVEVWEQWLPHRLIAMWVRRGLVTGLTSVAVAVAGERGARLRDTWMADLTGAPEEGLTMGRWQRVGHAAGFVVAAIRIRSRVLSEPLWRPADWLLSKDSRTNGFIATVVGAQAVYIVDDGGIPALVTEVWEPCGILGAGLYVLARWLRRVRGIELAAASAPPDE